MAIYTATITKTKDAEPMAIYTAPALMIARMRRTFALLGFLCSKKEIRWRDGRLE